MNKLFLAACVVFSIVFSSCEDIVNSEDNINKIKQIYNVVKTDQEHSVIMPLKVGNKWIYKVTEYDAQGVEQKINIDSIVVNEEVLFNGEKWFKVSYPPFGKNSVILLTNTDTGLMYNCGECNVYTALLAQYPVTSKEYISHVEKGVMIYDGKHGEIDTVDVNWNVKTNKTMPFIFAGKLYYGFSYYNSTTVTDKPDIIGLTSFEQIFIPDIGLYEYNSYQNINDTTKYLELKYSLLSFNELQSSGIFQNLFEFNYGNISLGDYYAYINNNVLINNTDSVIEIMYTTFSGNCDIKVWLNPNKYLNPGDALEVRFEVTPKQVGDLNGKVTIQTNKGNFDIMIKGTVI